MQQSAPSQTKNFCVSEDVPRILYNPHVHYRTHDSPTLFPVVGLISPTYVLPVSFFGTHFNIIFPSTPMSYEWSFSFGFSYLNPVLRSSSPPHVPRAPPILFLLIWLLEWYLAGSTNRGDSRKAIWRLRATVVTICTTRFNIHKFYVLPTQCIYVFCVDLRTNSDYYPIQH
jgi:hypothetical protein